MPAIFPRRREDGSCAVAARFTVGDQFDISRLEQFVSKWIVERIAREQTTVSEHFMITPVARVVTKNQVEIVFEGRTGSPRWKDWMVHMTIDLEDSKPFAAELVFDGFFDLIANKYHPASTRK